MEDLAETLPATVKQLVYARKLALRNQVVLPAPLIHDRRALSRWIEQQAALPAAPRSPHPSARQIAFAERLARLKRRAVPGECLRDRGLLSRWIEGNR